ncbi:MAG: hypothetical protein NFCOHLIN_01681 [Gammaproteobacteria bacterium]|nr:hypothetical protein [Gammaproteobacteria bacterium]
MDITRNEYGKPSDLTRSAPLLCSLICLLSSPGTYAAAWDINPQVTVQEVYSDNIELAPDGQEEGDFVTELTPAVSLEGRGMRYRVNVDYGLQGLIYADDSSRNRINNLLTGDGQLEVFRDHGFIDFGVNYGPQNVGNVGTVALDNISAVGRANVLSYSVTPNWVHEFGNYAVANVGYTYDEVVSSSDDLTDSSAHTVTANIHNGSHFETWLWSLDFLEQYVDDEAFGDTIRFRNVTGRTDYYFTPHWAAIGQLGYDDDDFDSEGDTSDVLWGVGFRWAPRRQTFIEVIGGERFFGKTFSAQAEHTSRRIRFVANYTEEPTSVRTTVLRNTAFPVLDPFGQPIINPVTGQPQQLNVLTPVETGEVVINKSFNAFGTYTGRYHDFALGFTRYELDYQLTGDSEESMGPNAAWTWRFTPTARSRLGIQYIDEEFRTGDESQYTIVDLALTRQFGRGLEASIGARYFNRDSSGAVPEYQENRAFLLLVKTF